MILREIFVKLGLDVDEASFAKGKLAADAVEEGIKLLAEKAVEAAKYFVEMIQKTAETGHQLELAAQQTGLTTTALQQLRRAAEFTGVEAEALDVGLFRLARSMTAAKKGGDEQSKAFAKLGVRVTDAHGKLRNTDDVITDLAGGFARLPDGLEKTNLAMEVFGRSGARLIPLLNKGKDGLVALRKEAFVMSEEQIVAGKEVVITQKQIAEVTRDLWKRAIAPLLPAINALLKRYLEWRRENAAVMAQRIEKYVGYVIKAVNLLADAFSFLVRNAGTVKAILLGLGATFVAINASAIAAAIAAGAAWLVAAAPFIAIGGVLAGILLLMDDIRVYKAGGKSLFGRFKAQIDEWLKPQANDPWWLKAIKDLVFYMEKALGVADKLGLRGQAAAKSVTPLGIAKTVSGAGTAATLGSIGSVVPQAGYARRFDERAEEARRAGGSYLDQVKAGFGFAYRGGSSNSNQQVNNITVVTQPGQSNEAIASMVSEQIQSHWDGQMESAAAAQ